MMDKTKMEMTDVIIIKIWTINTPTYKLHDTNIIPSTENTAFPLQGATS
jgi:hypothetical protein